MDLESRIREKDELNESAIEAFSRLNKEGFKTLVTKLIKSMGLEIINSIFEEEWAKIEADVGPQIRKANYPSYLIKVERRTDLVTPEDVQEFVSEREAIERGMIYISTSGFSSDAKLYAKEFDVEIADDMAFAQLLRKFDLLDDVMIYKDKEILKGEKGRFLPSVEELENIIEMGKSAYAKGKLEEAFSHYSHATRMKPKYDNAWIMKGVILSEQKKYEPALEAFMSALEINIENPKAWFSMGTTLFSLGRYEEELECYDKALELKSDFLAAHNNKGATLLHLERFEEAERTYDDILELNPEFKLAWNNKGIALKKLKRTEEALECFTNALNIDSRYLDAWLNRGLIYFKEKRYKEAHFCFDSALKLERDNIQVLYHKAKTLEAIGLYTKALEIYDRIIQLDPKFNPAKRRKKKAAKYLEQKGDAKVHDSFFMMSDEETKEYHLSPPEPERTRILLKKTVDELEGPENVQVINQPEFSEESENIIREVPFEPEPLPPEVIPPEERTEISEPPTKPPMDISPPVFSQETGDLKEMDRELKEKEQDLVQMEAWLRERYFTIENERKELKNIRLNMERKKEDLDNEKIRAQKIADELEKKAHNISRAENEIRTNRERLVQEREAIERERIELKYRADNITNESQGSVEDRIALERDIVKLELREKEITAANKVLITEREKVEKESIALKVEMEKMISARAELQARERSIDSREEEMKRRFDQIVNKSGDMAITEKELEEMARELKRTQDNLEKRAKVLRENEKRLLEKQKMLADNRAKMKGDQNSSPNMLNQMDTPWESNHGKVKPRRKKREVSFTPSGVLDSKSVSTKPQIMQPPSLSMTLGFESVERELLAGELESLKDILIMYGVRKMDSAQKRAEQLQENGLDSKLIWNIKGNILRQKKEYEKALECYNNALKRDQNYVVTLTNLMSLYYEMARYEESLQMCKKILQSRPSDEKFILTKAIFEAGLGQIDEAITTINNLLLDNNKLDVIWNLKGVLLFGMNQDEDALECFDEALKLNSENISALNNKGVILHDNGNLQDALKFFNLASNISSKEKIKQNIELTSKKLEGSQQLEVPPKDTGELDTEEEDNLEKENEPEDDATESAITEQPESIEEKEEEPEPEIESPTPTDSEPNKETDKESAADIFSELGKISETVSEESPLEIDSLSEEEMTEGSEDTELPSSDDGADLYMCPSCGSFVSPSADKCEKCGYTFDEEEDEEIEDHEDETELILPEQEELKDMENEIEDTVKEPEIVEEEPEVELNDGRAEEQKKEKPDIKSKMGAQKEGKGKEEQMEDDKIPTKDQVIEKFIQISGIGASKAEVLYDAGYTSYESLRSVETSDVGNVKGIGKTLAKNIKNQLKKKKFKDK